MELKILENKKTRMVFELKGEDHTFCNALKEELLSNKKVDIATYAITHPLIRIPKFIIETIGSETPKNALNSAISSLKKKNTEFLKLAKKV